MILSVLKLFNEVFIWLYFFFHLCFFLIFFFTMYLYLYWILFSYPSAACISWNSLRKLFVSSLNSSKHPLAPSLTFFEDIIRIILLASLSGILWKSLSVAWECWFLEETFGLDFSCRQCISFRICPPEATLLRLSVTPELREGLFGVPAAAWCLLNSVLLLTVQLRKDSLSIHGGSLEVTSSLGVGHR